MTTIAYKDGIIAYDSRLTAGEVILSDNIEKKVVVGDDVLFMTGPTSDYKSFIEAFKGNNIKKDTLDAAAIAVVGGNLFKCGYQDGDLWMCPIDELTPTSIGSGSEFAYGAMDCGKSAAESVKVASGRDVNTGGEIRTFKIFKEG